MTSSDDITDPFSERRRSLLTDFATVAGSHEAECIRAVWVQHCHELMGARGIFVVDDPKYNLTLPGDHNFGTTRFLRCLMGSTRLLNIQNKEGAREFRYSAPIFCDTNFISFRGTFFNGRDLKANADGFQEAVKFLLPIKNSLTANAPSRITTRTVIESVKSTWTRDDFSVIRFISRSKLCRQDALPDGRSRLLSTTRFSNTRVAPFVIEQPFLAP
jgi:hypothetical protein